MRTLTDITNYIFIEDNPEKADIIFIPGGSYAEVAEKSAELWNNKYAPFILPSGKYNPKRGSFSGLLSKMDIYSGVYATEWEFLKEVLLNNGVDETSVIREMNAENTYENAFNSRNVTDKMNMNIKKAIICCKSFHARRCLMFYQWAYPETDFLVCPSNVQGICKDNWFTTEHGIERVMGELTKCGSQFKEYIIQINK
jgi:uncharacterized SAM-binding protein YcdF (DUF218 family)